MAKSFIVLIMSSTLSEIPTLHIYHHHHHRAVRLTLFTQPAYTHGLFFTVNIFFYNIICTGLFSMLGLPCREARTISPLILLKELGYEQFADTVLFPGPGENKQPTGSRRPSPPQGSTAWLRPPARRPFLRHQLSSMDTDMCIGIERIRIHGCDNFPNNPIRGYVLTIF